MEKEKLYKIIHNVILKYGECGSSEADILAGSIARELEKYDFSDKYNYAAFMHSETYDWTSFGSTAKECKEKILKAWNSDDRREKMSLKKLESYYDIEIKRIVDDCVIEG